MPRIVSHATIVAYHNRIATAHKLINSFYRFNFSEINNAFRSGVVYPALLLESHDSDVRPNQNQTATFNERTISFMLLDHAPWDDYTMQEEVLDNLENIALDICSLLDRDRKDRTHWLWGKFDGQLKMEKVGPIFDNLYGWNIVYSIKNQEPMCFAPEKWDFN
jgi:hypothetical protein